MYEPSPSPEGCWEFVMWGAILLSGICGSQNKQQQKKEQKEDGTKEKRKKRGLVSFYIKKKKERKQHLSILYAMETQGL